MKPSIYIETTIPSYLVARRSRDLRIAADQESTEEWWEDWRHQYELYASSLVQEEAQRGDANFAAARMAILQGITILPPNEPSRQLARKLLLDQILPPNAGADAGHLAIAAAQRVDFLLTWNCTHINNPDLQRRIQKACADQGLVCPVLCTPAELLARKL